MPNKEPECERYPRQWKQPLILEIVEKVVLILFRLFSSLCVCKKNFEYKSSQHFNPDKYKL